MADYIDRESAVKLLTDSMEAYGTFAVERIMYRMARDKIKNIPPSEVVPVVRGEWILGESAIGQKQYFCSVCKDDDYWKRRFCFGDEKFCPNCGADMRGGKP